MKILERPSFEILTAVDGLAILRRLEVAGRTCYRSEDLITDASAGAFVRMLIGRGHESVLEHESLSVRFVVNRGLSHEMVRHRISSFSQSSTRYCNYAKDKFGGELTFWPMAEGLTDFQKLRRQEVYKVIESTYLAEVGEGIRPEQARDLLPNCLVTEIVWTANLREWRLVFRQRTAAAAHPQMREVMRPLLRTLRSRIPVVFDDVGEV